MSDMGGGSDPSTSEGFSQLPGVQAPHQKLGMGMSHGDDDTEMPQRDLPPYERGPPLSYMERIAMKRQLEEVCSIFLLLLMYFVAAFKIC